MEKKNMSKHFGIQNICKIANGLIGKGINDFLRVRPVPLRYSGSPDRFYHFGIATNLTVQIIGFL